MQKTCSYGESSYRTGLHLLTILHNLYLLRLAWRGFRHDENLSFGSLCCASFLSLIDLSIGKVSAFGTEKDLSFWGRTGLSFGSPWLGELPGLLCRADVAECEDSFKQHLLIFIYFLNTASWDFLVKIPSLGCRQHPMPLMKVREKKPSDT